MICVRISLVLLLLVTVCQAAAKVTNGHMYFLSSKGDDHSDGSFKYPWKTISRLNEIILQPGDQVFLRGGDTFTGTLSLDSNDAGSETKPIMITAYGKGYAWIDAGDSSGVLVKQAGYIHISRLGLKGSGRKNGNTQHGFAISYSHHVNVSEIEVKGFQKAGLMIYSCDSVRVANVYAHENGFAGILADGEYQQRNTRRIHITDCRAENNPGDPTNFTNHSGNGILAGNCSNILIEYCSATNNGWDMPRTGNGPVGIWCYEADSVIIQHCIAWQNKTSAGGGDGGGFDLDGGVTHSIIQYCLSYENQGSGFGIFQYDGASNWHDNTIRFCISENDGAVSPAGAGVFIWNSSMDTSQFKRCYFYNNTIYNKKAAAISYEAKSANTGFIFSNNIFIAKDSLITGTGGDAVNQSNSWYSFNLKMNDTVSWLPRFVNPGKATVANPRKLREWKAYKISQAARSSHKGADIKKLFDIDAGKYDFNGILLKENFIGACAW